MKKFILLTILIVCALTQIHSQPTMYLLPGNDKITLRGNSGGFVTNPTHFEVYRGTTPNSEVLYQTFVAGRDYNWEDTNVDQGTFYYYRIKARDDNAGTITDFSAEAKAKTIQGQGNHYVFDGIDDRVTIFSSRLFGIRGNSALNSIRFWVRIDEVPSGKDMEILRITETSTASNNNSLRVYHNSDRLVVSFFRDDHWTPNSSTRTYIASTRNIADGKWHSIAINKFGENGTFVSVDGVGYTLLHSSGQVAASYDFDIHQMIIGGKSNASTSFFKGAIDNLRLFNGSNLRHHWKFDEFDGTSKALNSVVNNPSLNKENGVSSSATSTFGPVTTVSKVNEVSVRWNKDIDLPDEVLESYEVWRKEGDGSLQFLTSVVKEDTAYLDQAVTPGVTYEYEVRSIKSNNVIVRSETDLAKPVAGFDRHLVVNGAGEVQIPDDDLFTDNNGTIEFWMRTTDFNVVPGRRHSIINKHDEAGSQNGFNFVLDRSTLYVQVKDNGATTRSIRPTTPFPLNDDTWHHVALAYEWGGTSTLYIDGVAQVTENNTPAFTLSSEPFRIGRSPASFWDPYIGRIDEVYVWDKVLTATEIASQMNQRIPGDTEGLSGVWRFDLSNTNETAFEDGVNEFDGSVVGGLKNQIVERKHVASSYNGSQVDLEWDFQLNNNITGFEVSRDDFLGNIPTRLATLSNTASTYSDLTAQDNAIYQYIVRALTDDAPTIGTDIIATRTDFSGMLNFGSDGGSVEISEEVTDNQTGTIEFRFRSNVDPPTGKSYSMLNRHDNVGSDNGFNFTLSKGNILVQFKESQSSTNISHDANLIDGEWHNVALVYDYSGTNTLYVDGTEVGSATLSGLEITSEPTRIGSSVNAFWEDYEGQVDELRMWTKQLTVTEINASKDIRLPGNTPDLGAVWHFDGSLGWSFTLDNGSDNYDGQLAGDVRLFLDPVLLTFSSPSGGFSETSGNNGQMLGQMIISIEGSSFKNPSTQINSNQFAIENEIQVADPFDPLFENLTTGLNPILTVNPDGKSANLTFEGEAIYHTDEFSTSSLILSFDPAIFVDGNPVENATNANTNISYTLRDNIAPTLDLPIPDYELPIEVGNVEVDLFNHFSDPDTDQNFQFLIQTDNDFVSASVDGGILIASPEGQGEGSTEITVTFRDNNGGEVSDTFIVSVVKTPQSILFLPIDDIDLVDKNTVELSATATSGLNVEFELLTGDGSINNDVLTVNQTGVFEVRAIQPGDDTYAAADPVVMSFNATDSRKDDQTITFTDNLEGLAYGDDVITLSASASSGLDVTYDVTGPIQVNGSILNITGAGAARITANQPGDANYNPADGITITFNIEKKLLTATADSQTIVFGDAIPEFTVSYNGFIEEDDETNIDILPGTETSADAFSDVGTYAIEVGSGRDNNYAFEYVNGTLTIEKADQVITFSAPSDLDLAQSDRRVLSASSSSGLDVDFNLLEGIGTIEGNVVTADETGIFRVIATQNGNMNYNSADAVIRSFIVTNSNKANQTITFEMIPDAVYGDVVEFNATSSSGMPVNIEVLNGQGELSGSTLTLKGLGTFEIEASQQGSNEFNPAPIVVNTFEVTKAPLTITAEDITVSVGDAIPTLTMAYDGLKLEEDASVIDVLPTINTTATSSSTTGEYAITLDGGSDNFYELTLINGTLTIDPLTLSVADEVLTVYPNPVVHQLQVKGGVVVAMRLLSMEGKVVRSLKGNRMEVADLDAGNYLLQVEKTDGKVSIHRIIKKN